MKFRKQIIDAIEINIDIEEGKCYRKEFYIGTFNMAEFMYFRVLPFNKVVMVFSDHITVGKSLNDYITDGHETISEITREEFDSEVNKFMAKIL